jgi:putative addiction module CopG family antidote
MKLRFHWNSTGVLIFPKTPAQFASSSTSVRKDIPFNRGHRENDNGVMTVSLPTPLEEFIRRKVATGEFHSVDEVVCEGLKLLQRRELWIAEAQQKIDAG